MAFKSSFSKLKEAKNCMSKVFFIRWPKDGCLRLGYFNPVGRFTYFPDGFDP